MYEIERKFVLDALPNDIGDEPPTLIDQGYLAVTDDLEVRLRARAGDRLLTVKAGRGAVRRETTIRLTKEQFDELWVLTDGHRIRKRRWVIVHGPAGDLEIEIEIEIDRFEGPLDGLLIAEVEFESEDASRAFIPPAWFGREVTDDDRYRNAALATEPPPL